MPEELPAASPFTWKPENCWSPSYVTAAVLRRAARGDAEPSRWQAMASMGRQHRVAHGRPAFRAPRVGGASSGIPFLSEPREPTKAQRFGPMRLATPTDRSTDRPRTDRPADRPTDRDRPIDRDQPTDRPTDRFPVASRIGRDCSMNQNPLMNLWRTWQIRRWRRSRCGEWSRRYPSRLHRAAVSG